MNTQPFLILLAILAMGSPLTVQQSSEPCKAPTKYQNKNQVDPEPLSLMIVSGRVISEVGDVGAARELGPVLGACLSLFTAQGHRLMATTVADREGRFQFKKVPIGKYRLVVRAEPLCLANVPVRVFRQRSKKPSRSKQVVLHMRPAGIDDCSYGDYK
jgi:hypothetical protein